MVKRVDGKKGESARLKKLREQAKDLSGFDRALLDDLLVEYDSLATMTEDLRKRVEDEGVMEMALVENIQREDLNAIEIALAYQHLAETTGMTQAKISERVGKSRTAVTNYMRLLKLPAQVQMALKNHEIDMGHARALLSIESPSQQIKLFKEVQRHGYSVRRVEEIAQQLKNGEDVKTPQGKQTSKSKLPKEFDILRDRLANFFHTRVQMTCSAKGKGKISIAFDNEEQLERIMNVLDSVKGEG
jgi:ParB family chromosome partitioning protein